ncbi:MAG: hypothetical protein JWP75_1282 [Frondihabitans sp.]|nr:hypothetical protein [Frondihabitans sp.]
MQEVTLARQVEATSIVLWALVGAVAGAVLGAVSTACAIGAAVWRTASDGVATTFAPIVSVHVADGGGITAESGNGLFLPAGLLAIVGATVTVGVLLLRRRVIRVGEARHE